MSELAVAGTNLPALPVSPPPLPPEPAYRQAGVAALAHMAETEFQTRLAALKQGQARLAVIHRELMQPEVDYGTIPGTQKPTLYKPGAEKLCLFYGLVPVFRETVALCDDGTAPPISIVVDCRLHVGCTDGPVVGTASGACNSWEKKYRYRYAERVCPACGTYGTIRRGREEYGGGWYCHKQSGCGQKFVANDPAITDQHPGQIDNPDPWELQNTILKIATKRSLTAAVLIATATSGLYTQDMEDHPEGTTSPAAPAAEAAPRFRPPAPAANAPDSGPKPAGRAEGPGKGQSGPAAAHNAPTGHSGGSLVCTGANCGKALTKGQHDVSVRAFGQPLCPACQKRHARGPEPTPESGGDAAAVQAGAAGVPTSTPVGTDRPASDRERENCRQWIAYGTAQGVVTDEEAAFLTEKVADPEVTVAEVASIAEEIDREVKQREPLPPAPEGPLSEGEKEIDPFEENEE